MTDEERIYLHELNETYTDGFVRGYNRGFMDGIRMAAQLKKEEEFNDEETEA